MIDKRIKLPNGEIRITGIHCDGSIEIHQTRYGEPNRRTRNDWINIPAKELAQFVKELGL